MSTRSETRTTWTARGLVRYEIEVRHDDLNKYQLIRGDDPNIVEQRALAKLAEWDDIWKRRSDVEARRKDVNDRQAEATERTKEARTALDALESILAHTLRVDDRVDWETLKNKKDFPKPRPPVFGDPAPPQPPTIPPAPVRMDPKYTPKLSILDRVVASRRIRRVQAAADAFAADSSAWVGAKADALARFEKQKLTHAQQLSDLKKQHEAAVQEWECEHDAYLSHREETNQAVEAKKAKYLALDPQAIVDYCDIVLSNSSYPDDFPKSWDLDYNVESKILVVDYRLPAPEDLPTLSEVRYVKSQDEFVEKALSDSQLNKVYDGVVYQVTLRSIHELFEADTVGAVAAAVFNGYVHSIDKATGKEVDACILTIQASREEFLEINLASVDPKACFKKFKGVGSSKLHSLSPVAPLLKIEREDARFVTPYAVADQLDSGANLAMMDWEDFEHLIRELFEKEFVSAGGDVKITRASRDGGIDAVVFDPDPIRGGKIVIQAKRYTNTVSVSAVRDLYGTVLNEGANKGILVTTADYGPDAYEFARGKPLVLLSGGNLLHMLGKHGVRARIDLKEAREVLSAEAKRTK